jgi:hypothetical protein
MFHSESHRVPLGVLVKSFPAAAARLAPDELRQSVELAEQASRVRDGLAAGAFVGEARLLAAQLLDTARHRLNCRGIHCQAE